MTQWTPANIPGSGLEAAGCTAADHEREADDQKPLIAFAVPYLTEAAGAITSTGIRVSVDVDPTGTGFPVYPARDQVVPDDFSGVMDSGTEADKDTGSRALLGPVKARGLTVAGGMGGEGTISPEMREQLVNPANGKALKNQQLNVGSVTVTVNSGVAQSNGAGFSVANEAGRIHDGDGAGVLLVSATGDFREGDMLYWDGGAGNGKYDAGAEVDTMLEVSGGTASLEMALDEVTSGRTNNIYYVPNGKDPLRSGSIALGYGVEFSKATNSTPPATGSRAELSYLGAQDALLAYAIAPPSNPDDSNIRVRCDKSTPCQVYFACDGADGIRLLRQDGRHDWRPDGGDRQRGRTRGHHRRGRCGLHGQDVLRSHRVQHQRAGSDPQWRRLGEQHLRRRSAGRASAPSHQQCDVSNYQCNGRYDGGWRGEGGRVRETSREGW